MKIGSRSVFRCLSESGGQGLTVNQLLERNGLKKSNKNKIRKALRTLMNRGFVEKSKNLYFPCNQAKAFKKITKASGSLKNGEEGHFLFEGGNPFVVDLWGNRLKLPQDQAMFAMHGDRVAFRRSGNRTSLREILSRNAKSLTGILSWKKKKMYLRPINVHYPYLFVVEELRKGVSPEAGKAYHAKILRYPAEGVEPSCVAISENPDFSPFPLVSRANAVAKQKLGFVRVSSEKVWSESQKIPSRVAFSSKSGRIDLRSIPFVTVDGEDAKDFDDAIYAERTSSGYLIYVAVADVAEYVSENGAMDEEAKKRGCSVYFPGECVPMLPERLSNGICSLKPNVNRKSLVCKIHLNEDGKYLKGEIFEAVIKSRARLTYEAIDRALETGRWKNPKNLPHLEAMINLYLRISEILKEKRKKRGALDFSFPDAVFECEEGRVSAISRKYPSASMGMIEQFMLEANEYVGRFCEENRIPLLWRNHPQLSKGDLKALAVKLTHYGLRLNKAFKIKGVSDLLSKISQSASPPLFEKMILTSMPKAYYDSQNIGHFGLAGKRYTHFTSPIRRYPDLFVHRNLKKFLHGQKTVPVPSDLGELLSKSEREAQAAENLSKKILQTHYAQNRIGDVFLCRVSGLSHKACFLESVEQCFEGVLLTNELENEGYRFEKSKHCLCNRKTQREIRIQDTCLAMIIGILPHKQWILMRVLSWQPSEKFTNNL